jgi:hypothetical protein
VGGGGDLAVAPIVSAYVLPLRWTEAGPIEELAAYLREIDGEVDEILVVDGSPSPLFDRHRSALAGVARHLPPHRDLNFQMGKVNGVITGVRESESETIVIADDDVRYDPRSLRRTLALLVEADLVVIPKHVVHPDLLGGWRCRSPSNKEEPDEAPR